MGTPNQKGTGTGTGQMPAPVGMPSIPPLNLASSAAVNDSGPGGISGGGSKVINYGGNPNIKGQSAIITALIVAGFLGFAYIRWGRK